MSQTPGWAQMPFWSLYKRGKKVGYPTEELLSVYRDHGVIRKSDRDDNWNRPGEDMSAYQLVEPGDLVLNKMKTWQGSLGVSAYRGIVSPAYFVYKPQTNHNSRFMHYALRSDHYIKFYASISKGVRPNQWDLQPEQLDVMSVKLPDFPTQQRIADYLDRETGEIDAMIATMDELSGQLEERKDASMAAETSHGPLIPLQHLVVAGAPLTYGIVQAGEPVSSGVPYIGPSDIVADQVVPVEALRNTTAEIAANYRRSTLRGGDLVVSIGPAYGKTTLIPDSHAGANLTQDTARIRCDLTIAVPRYVQWALRSRVTQEYWNSTIMGATFRRLNLNGVATTRVHLPSVEDQQRIADHLDEVTGKIDAMLAKVTELKSLLTERRAALITDVVTGRKDVA